MKPITFWQRLSRAVQEPYFIIGSVLVVLLVLVVVLGPELAPHNPYLVKRIQWIDGELHKAPFPPSDLYPLGTDDQGRDQLSLLLGLKLHNTRRAMVSLLKSYLDGGLYILTTSWSTPHPGACLRIAEQT